MWSRELNYSIECHWSRCTTSTCSLLNNSLFAFHPLNVLGSNAEDQSLPHFQPSHKSKGDCLKTWQKQKIYLRNYTPINIIVCDYGSQQLEHIISNYRAFKSGQTCCQADSWGSRWQQQSWNMTGRYNSRGTAFAISPRHWFGENILWRRSVPLLTGTSGKIVQKCADMEQYSTETGPSSHVSMLATMPN